MSEESMLALAESRLETFKRFSGEPGLREVTRLLSAVGDPHKKLKFVHVAGTNGKGSTTAMIASALTSAGYVTGMYTSPSIEKITERVCIGMEPAEDGVFADACMRVMDAADALGEAPPQFDILTAAAFLIFAESGCEIVVAEVGLGGRFDTTNVIEASEVSVITSISLDHTAQLGGDISEIAAEKCGIIKPGCPVVSSPGQIDSAERVISDRAEALGSRLCIPDTELLEITEMSSGGSVFAYGKAEYKTTMPGRHFIFNAITAIEALEVLREKGWKILPRDIEKGISTPPLAGRLQTVHTEPAILLDGAHNPDAAEKLCAALGELFAGKRIITVMGMFSDKDYESCICRVAEISDVFIAAQPEGFRALDAQITAEFALGKAGLTAICRRPERALGAALRFCREDDVILCCGSFALISAVRKTVAKYGGRLPDFTK